MADPRGDFFGWTECLLDPAADPGGQLVAARAWCDWAMGELGIDQETIDGPEGDAAVTGTALDSGTAISPQRAALCVREHRRTAVFLQAMAAAVRTARARFPGEPIHVVEAGCGPLAALTMPLAVRYAPEEVSFTLIDVHATSLAGVRRLAEALRVADSFRPAICGDATRVRFAEADRPHVIGCEVLRRALRDEPQVAVTRALAPQLRPGGLFVPERIEVAAGFLHGAAWRRRMEGCAAPEDPPAVQRVGEAFTLDARCVGEMAEAAGWVVGRRVTVPPHDRGRTPLRLLTRIEAFRGCVLDDFDSSLTLPVRINYPEAWAERGGAAIFGYRLGAEPCVAILDRETVG